MKSMKHRTCSLGGFAEAVVLLTAFLLAPNADANGIRNPPAGAAALSLDGGKSTLVDDPSVISCNPANLAGIEKPALMVSMNGIVGKATLDRAVLAELNTVDRLAVLPDMFAVYPIGEGRYVLGLGLNTPFGQSVEWDKNQAFPYYSQLGVVNVNPTFATRLTGSISLGVGADLYFSSVKTRSFSLVLGDINMSGTGAGFGANAAVTWHPTDMQQVALTCRSGFDIDYDGDTEINGALPVLPPPLVDKSDFSTTIKYPTIATLGYGIQLTDKLKVGVDVEWVQASRNDTMPLNLGRNQVLVLPDAEIVNNWDDNWTYGVAGQYDLNEKVSFRGSYKFMETPIPDNTYSPSYADEDRHIMALGMGLKQGAHSLDLACAFNVIADRDVVAGANAPSGTYSYTSMIGSVAYAFSF
jgi:long-chain fatty acid transport protein